MNTRKPNRGGKPVRLSESKLKAIIAESMRKVLKEEGETESGYYIGWYMDDSDNVFDRSEIVWGKSPNDVPNDEGVYALTQEGLELYNEWEDDASVGYDLGYGRMQGLAGKIGGTQWDIWQYLTSDESLAKRVG